MKRRIQIAIIAILALLINSVCVCAAVGPNCRVASCAAHEHHDTCPAHQRHQNSRSGHDCCQTSACSNPTEIRADTASHTSNHLPGPPITIVRAPILDLANLAARLLPLREAHSPPSAVPVFLTIRTLLL
jgi:hypothetical protein